MFVASSIQKMIGKYLLRLVVVMGSCLAAAFLIQLVFDIDMHRELIFAGAIAMAVPFKKKFVPQKQ